MRILYTGYGVEGGEQAAKQIVGDARRYDAAIFTEDLTAIYAMNTLQNMGYRIPEDIAVIGCNNSEYSRISNPPLTTINNKGELLSDRKVGESVSDYPSGACRPSDDLDRKGRGSCQK